MSLPIRQKSTKNLHFHSDNHHPNLKTSQLITEPDSKTFSVSLKTLSQKYDTSNTQNNKFSQKIKSMQTRYYDASLIYMENQIDFSDSSEYLKRFYFHQEFQGKIKMLGEYYKYHHDHPRIFLEEVEQIMTSLQEDQRELQYIKVREKIEEERLANQQRQNRNLQTQNPNLKHMDSKKNVLHHDNKKPKKTQFILQNILLQYATDFQDQTQKKSIIQKQPLKNQPKRKTSATPTLTSKQKTLPKSCSSTIKHMYSSNRQHTKSRQNSKNNIKQAFTLKNAETKEIKNLQSKYTQILSELFKKKRSSSKPNIIEHKIETLKNKTHEKTSKQESMPSKSSRKIQGNGSAVVQSKDNLQKEQNQKIARSKSQAAMNVCKSNKILKTFKAKLCENAINLNTKPIGNPSGKQTKRQKHQQYSKQQTLKRDKYSSSKSLRQIMNQKPLKAVKIFQITKKDLLVDHSSKNSSIQKDKAKCQQKQQKKQIVRKQRNENKENEIPASKDKKRTTSFKQGIDLNAIQKRNESTKKTQKEPMTVTMFGRVLKTKIRG